MSLHATYASHIVDILAIPFFLAMALYYGAKENKTTRDYAIVIFSIAGLVVDIAFTATNLRTKIGGEKKKNETIDTANSTFRPHDPRTDHAY